MIRKILKEHDHSYKNYPILSFFCDWSVHAQMDRVAAKKMLDIVQDFYRGLDRYLGIRKNTSFFPFVMLIVLRKELKLFFSRNNLPLMLIDDDKKWERFLFLILRVIIDCPLISNSGYIREGRFINFKHKKNIIFKLKLRDGNTQTFISKNKNDFIKTDID